MDHNPKRGSPVTILTDHKPHVPWRRVRAVITRHGDEHELDLHVADEHDPSIAAWLATGDRPAAGRIPVMPHAERRAFPPSFDDDETFSARLNQMARLMHSTADRLAAENDLRAARLLRWSGAAISRSAAAGVELAAWAGQRFQPMRQAAVAVRRRNRNVAQTGELGQLLVAGQLPPAAVVSAMVRRSLHATNTAEDSQRIPAMTPALLAELDAQKATAA